MALSLLVLTAKIFHNTQVLQYWHQRISTEIILVSEGFALANLGIVSPTIYTIQALLVNLRLKGPFTLSVSDSENKKHIKELSEKIKV